MSTTHLNNQNNYLQSGMPDCEKYSRGVPDNTTPIIRGTSEMLALLTYVGFILMWACYFMYCGMIRNIYPEGFEPSCSESDSDDESLSEVDDSSDSDDPLKEDSDEPKAKTE